MDNKYFKEFYTCPVSNQPIEKKTYFVCPSCGKAICREYDIVFGTVKYCGNCGTELDSAREEALALLREKKKSDTSKA